MLVFADDDEDILELTTVRLERHGYDVKVATDGNAALELIREHVPDLALLDFRMPGLNGLEVCRAVKQSPELRHIPVILFSAATGSTGLTSEMLADAGAAEWILKPSEPADLLAAIERHSATP